MGKWIGLAVIGIMILSCGLSYASGGTDYAANASPAVVHSGNSDAGDSASRELVFPYTTRNLFIENGNTVDIYVNLKGNDTLANTLNGKRVAVGAGQILWLSNFATDRITVFHNSAKSASPVSVVATY
jgi:hypothetical protein